MSLTHSHALNISAPQFEMSFMLLAILDEQAQACTANIELKEFTDVSYTPCTTRGTN